MRRISWALALLGIVICAGFGVATRLCYTDYSEQTNALDALPYRIVPYSASQVDSDEEFFGCDFRDVRELLNGAELVVAGEFTGERVYSYQAFLSTVKVDDVIKGDAALAGHEIQVYEPMAIVDWDERLVLPQFTYAAGASPMRAHARYLFLLESRDEALGSSDGKDPYSFYAEAGTGINPFARVCLDEPLLDAVEEGSALSFGESQRFDVFAENEESIEDYEQVKEELLNALAEKRVGD